MYRNDIDKEDEALSPPKYVMNSFHFSLNHDDDKSEIKNFIESPLIKQQYLDYLAAERPDTRIENGEESVIGDYKFHDLEEDFYDFPRASHISSKCMSTATTILRFMNLKPTNGLPNLISMLTYLHKAGVIQGDVKLENDIKLENVLIDENNNAWIIDSSEGYTREIIERESWKPGTMEDDLQGLEKIVEYVFSKRVE